MVNKMTVLPIMLRMTMVKSKIFHDCLKKCRRKATILAIASKVKMAVNTRFIICEDPTKHRIAVKEFNLTTTKSKTVGICKTHHAVYLFCFIGRNTSQ